MAIQERQTSGTGDRLRKRKMNRQTVDYLLTAFAPSILWMTSVIASPGSPRPRTPSFLTTGSPSLKTTTVGTTLISKISHRGFSRSLKSTIAFVIPFASGVDSKIGLNFMQNGHQSAVNTVTNVPAFLSWVPLKSCGSRDVISTLMDSNYGTGLSSYL